MGLALVLAALAASEPLKVAVVVAPKPYFAGQGIEVTVEVEPGSGPAVLVVEPPRVKDALVFPVPADRDQPWLARFVVVPEHPGPLDLLPFRVRSGDRLGASRPIRLPVANLPTEGRTAAFLGGVGGFEVRAEAEPSSVRAGDTLEVRVTLAGAAAWGSLRVPDLSDWKTATLDVQPLPDRLDVAALPVRTFRYRLRPLKSGLVVLPPVRISAFDPASRRYATRTTSSLTIRVEEPSRFDPARLDYSQAPRGLRAGPISLALGAFVVVLGSTLTVWFVARRRRKSRAIDPRRLAIELSEGLNSGAEADADEVELARRVVEALTTFLHRVGGRPLGVLTPPEARLGFARLTDDPSLSAWAEALVVRSDRARYGRPGGEVGELASEAKRFFEALAGSKMRVEGPGEAVETAANF